MKQWNSETLEFLPTSCRDLQLFSPTEQQDPSRMFTVQAKQGKTGLQNKGKHCTNNSCFLVFRQISFLSIYQNPFQTDLRLLPLVKGNNYWWFSSQKSGFLSFPLKPLLNLSYLLNFTWLYFSFNFTQLNFCSTDLLFSRYFLSKLQYVWNLI